MTPSCCQRPDADQSSSLHLIALFRDGLSDRRFIQASLDLHQPGFQVDLDLGAAVARLNRIDHRALTMPASHALYFECLHLSSSIETAEAILKLATLARSSFCVTRAKLDLAIRLRVVIVSGS